MSLKKDKQTFKEILQILAKRSTCASVQVASLIVRDGRIISTGWNGVTSGSKHCNKIFDKKSTNWNREEHHKFSLKNEIHSEANALMMAARNGIKVDGCDIFCTHSPCNDCAKLLVAAGIKRFFYIEPYDLDNTIKWLKNKGIQMEQL